MLHQHVLRLALCFTKGCLLVCQGLLDCTWKLAVSPSTGSPEEATWAVAPLPCPHCGCGICPRVRQRGKAGQAGYGCVCLLLPEQVNSVGSGTTAEAQQIPANITEPGLAYTHENPSVRLFLHCSQKPDFTPRASLLM